MDIIYYTLIGSPIALAIALVVIYAIAEKFGSDLPRWGDE